MTSVEWRGRTAASGSTKQTLRLRRIPVPLAAFGLACEADFCRNLQWLIRFGLRPAVAQQARSRHQRQPVGAEERRDRA
jgi:hypothetical protein